jgi:hypothetical protein
MKVTIEIADAVLEEAQDFALREGTTVDALVEDGMRRILDGKRETTRPGPQDAAVETGSQDAAPTQGEAPRRGFLDSLDHIGAAFGDLEA